MIIQNNEDALRVPCQIVQPEEVGELVELLERELEHSARLGNAGIGLACPQIGLARQLAIVRINSEFSVNLVNARIEQGYDLAMFQNEGCLSFPGRVESTMRYQEICVSNSDKPNRFIATGLFAVCIQHELDHLNGILLPDRALKKTSIKVGRNDLCPCGSGVKFKRCCGRM